VFKRRIVCISGFLQPRFGRTGMARLWKDLRLTWGSATTEITLHPWDDNWKSFAELVVDTCADSRELELDVVAYSWGVGYGARRLAEYLLGEGIAIRTLLACDGVYWSQWAKWRAIGSPLLGEPVIELPANVREVFMLRQRETLPSGHRILVNDPSVSVYDRGFQPFPHVDVDGCPEFHRLVRSVIGQKYGHR
jgi:hypothetical protein